MTFDEWFADVKELAKEYDWPVGNPEDWREFYDDGYSPREAILEDISQA